MQHMSFEIKMLIYIYGFDPSEKNNNNTKHFPKVSKVLVCTASPFLILMFACEVLPRHAEAIIWLFNYILMIEVK